MEYYFIFLVSERKLCCDPSLEPSPQDGSNDGSEHTFSYGKLTPNYPRFISSSVTFYFFRFTETSCRSTVRSAAGDSDTSGAGTDIPSNIRGTGNLNAASVILHMSGMDTSDWIHFQGASNCAISMFTQIILVTVRSLIKFVTGGKTTQF